MMNAFVETRTYDMGSGFMMDVVVTRDQYEMWVWMEGCGVKDFAYGSLKRDVSMDDFLRLAEKNYPSYARTYRKNYA